MSLDNLAYQQRFCEFAGWSKNMVAKGKDTADSTTVPDNVCLLCLRPAADMQVLPERRCRHLICRQCVLTRKALASDLVASAT